MVQDVSAAFSTSTLFRQLGARHVSVLSFGAIILSFYFSGAPSIAAPFPTTPVVQVNEFTSGRQLNSVVAALPNGSSVVAWEDKPDGEDRRIFARLVNAAGAAIGGEFQVSPFTSEDRVSADIAALPNGDFIVVWENDISGAASISSRRYDSAGTASSAFTVGGPDANVNTYSPAIVNSDADSFVVVWESYDSSSNESSFRARLLDSAGAAEGPVFTLESASSGEFISSLALTERPGDGFFALWDDSQNDELTVRAYSASGAPDGAPVVATTGSFSYPTLGGLDDDGFLVVWGTFADGLRYQRFRGDGSMGLEIDITPSSETQRDPVVIALPNERAAVAWWLFGDPDTIEVQIIAADDSVEAAFTVDESAATVSRPDLAYDADRDELVVTWTKRGGAGTDQEEVYLRRYALAGLFGDDFESGDISAWSESTP